MGYIIEFEKYPHQKIIGNSVGTYEAEGSHIDTWVFYSELGFAHDTTKTTNRTLRKCFGSKDKIRLSQKSKDTIVITDENKKYFFHVKTTMYHYLGSSEMVEKILRESKRHPRRDDLVKQLRTIDRQIKFSKKITQFTCFDDKCHLDLKNKVFVEYFGEMPDGPPWPHLNARSSTRPFIPSRRADLEEVKQYLIDQNMRVSEAYLKSLKDKKEFEGVRYPSVLHRTAHKHRKETGQIKNDNPDLFDETMALIRKYQDVNNTFLQHLHFIKQSKCQLQFVTKSQQWTW